MNAPDFELATVKEKASGPAAHYIDPGLVDHIFKNIIDEGINPATGRGLFHSLIRETYKAMPENYNRKFYGDLTIPYGREFYGALDHPQTGRPLPDDQLLRIVGCQFRRGDVVLWPEPKRGKYAPPLYGNIIRIDPVVNPTRSGVFVQMIGHQKDMAADWLAYKLTRFVNEAIPLLREVSINRAAESLGFDLAFLFIPAGHYWFNTPIYFPTARKTG